MKILLITLSILWATNSIAQDKNDFESLCMEDFSQAQEYAIKNNKPILISFSGSDWCKFCIKLRTQVLDTKEFIDFASDAFVIVNADFPYHKKISSTQRKQNEALAEKYNPDGAFPKLVIISPQGEVLYSCGFLSYTPVQYIDLLKKHI